MVGSRGYCDVCNVELPSDVEAVEKHNSGKRHIKNSATKLQLETLAKRSIFIHGFEPKYFETREHILKSALIERFGQIDRLLLDHNKGTFAIVEFNQQSSVTNALAAARITIDSQSIIIKERKIDFDPKSTPAFDIHNIIVKLKSIAERCDFVGQLDHLIELVAIGEDEIDARSKIAIQLTTALRQYMPDTAVVELFGSSITGLGTIDSDIDATLIFGDEPLSTQFDIDAKRQRTKFDLMTIGDLDAMTGNNRIRVDELAKLSSVDQVRYLSKVLNLLRKSAVLSIGAQTPLLDARCPLVRFVLDKRRSIDLSIDNRLAINNSHWLADLISADHSGNLRRFLFIIRIWAMANELMNNGEQCQFNAYILTLMCIVFLQNNRLLKPIESGISMRLIRNWPIDYAHQLVDLSNISFPDLIKDFFNFYAQLPFKSIVLSARLGRSITFDEFDRIYAQDARIMKHFKKSPICVQDPFDLSHNTSAHISDKLLAHCRRRMAIGIAKLKSNGADLIRLLDVDDDKRPTSSNAADHLTIALTFPIAVDQLLDKTVALVDRILQQLLMFRNSCEPTTKRRRYDDEHRRDSEYVVDHRLWMGRRVLRRQIARDQPTLDDYAAELEVSRRLSVDQQPESAPILQLQVNIDLINSTTINVQLRRIHGAEIEFRNLCHFLEPFMQKIAVSSFIDQQSIDASGNGESMET